jgi:hypothetical protein
MNSQFMVQRHFLNTQLTRWVVQEVCLVGEAGGKYFNFFKLTFIFPIDYSEVQVEMRHWNLANFIFTKSN